jgi:hypothetical protein
MDNNYFDARYDIFFEDNNISKVILYIDNEENFEEGITVNKLKDAFQYFNNTLLNNHIILDFNKIRNNTAYNGMTDFVSQAKENSIILKIDGDIGAITQSLESQVATYFLTAKTDSNPRYLISKLNKVFKPNVEKLDLDGGTGAGG